MKALAYIYVNKSRLRALQDDAKRIGAGAVRVSDDFKTVTQRLDWDIRSFPGVNTAIGQINSELEAQRLALARMERFFGFAARQYEGLDAVQESALSKLIRSTELSVRTDPIIGAVAGWFSDRIRKKLTDFLDGKKTQVAKIYVDFAARILGYQSITLGKVGRGLMASIRKVRSKKEPYQLKTMVKMVGVRAKNLGLSSIKSRMKNAFTAAKTTVMKTMGRVSAVGAIIEAGEGLYYGIKNKEPLGKIAAGLGFDALAGAGKAAAALAVSALAAGAVVALAPAAVPAALVTAAAMGVGGVAGGFASGMIGKVLGSPDGSGYRLIKDKGGNRVTVREWFTSTVPDAVGDAANWIGAAGKGAVRVTIPSANYGCVPCY